METKKKFTSYYFRHGIIGFEEFQELEEAAKFLAIQEDNGNISSIGVYDKVNKTFYSDDNNEVFVISNESLLSYSLSELKKIAIEPVEVKSLVSIKKDGGSSIGDFK